VFRSIGFTAYNSVTFADITASGMAHANTLSSTLQQVAAGLGVAIGALSLRLGQTLHGSIDRGGGTHVAYTIAFAVVAILVLPAVIEVWTLPRTAGSSIGGGGGRGGGGVSGSRESRQVDGS
jgi:hypothetical protein